MKPMSAPSCFYSGDPLIAAARSLGGKSGTPAANPAGARDLNPIIAPPAKSPAVPARINHLPWWKRALDLSVCALAFPLLALCALAMTLITRLVSPGPVFFRQTRIGHQGRRFKIYKFRTMRVGADNVVHQNYCKDLIGTNAPMVKLDSHGDARLIPGAWLLRASGLDELPQLINVFLGEMSLVGPRPCLPAEFELYAPTHRERCDVLPGLTGLWQVSGKNRTTFEEMINLDRRYTREFSIGLDLKIILLTAPCLFIQVLETRQARKTQTNPPISGASVVPFRPSSDSRAP
ncbi:MAG TPA: sugar transferase [Candidatus Didemnitutus sp.]|nr:sugar transferase [Candidatus Didemnitutus sp.]